MLLAGGCGASAGPAPGTAPARHSATAQPRSADASASVAAAGTGGSPRPSHIVVVIEENHAAADIIGNPEAPYLNRLARAGASFTRSYAVTHPSQPNYLALFSGSTHGLSSDACPQRLTGTTLAGQLARAGKGFRGYSEGLPRAGYLGCSAGDYARKHAPWTDFPALPASVNQPFSAFPHDYSALPALAVVVPDLAHDMHDGTIAQGDAWLRRHLSGYVRWATGHNSLLLVTWDEDDGSHGNRIPTILVGAHVRPGRYAEHVTHYRVLRTLEALERLGGIGASTGVAPITDVWTG
jgi:acid phosphatase